MAFLRHAAAFTVVTRGGGALFKPPLSLAQRRHWEVVGLNASRGVAEWPLTGKFGSRGRASHF
jgi:hypothetical protein